MNEELKKAIAKSQAAAQAPHPGERSAFKALLLSNPNYFGNLAASKFQPVVPISGNTHYEELGCVGYQPEQERLEAVVYVNQPAGYGSGVCGPGTPEYVRFYLSFDHGATWQDQGLTSFRAYDIPAGTEGSRRLEYAASMAVDPKRKFCFFDPLIRVRAILSWNDPPAPNQPSWTPVWGNVRDAIIQVEPVRYFFPLDLLEATKVKLSPAAAELLHLDAPVASSKKILAAPELAALYRGKGVPAHRFAYKELASFASSRTALSAGALLDLLPGVTIDGSIVDLLFPKTDGDTSYEELACIGLDPNFPDTLVGVIRVKKPVGYSGGPCTDGSREYVTFWADFNGNGTFETCLGTAQVRVHDLSNITPQGVHYAVRLPVDLSAHRQPCAQGPKVVRIRATLSWNSPAPCFNPSHVPTWGNREETLIHIGAVAAAPAGKIAILGGIPVAHIGNASGLTTPTAVFATNNLPPDSLGRPCPFAGRVTSQGSPLLGHSYKVEVTPVGGGAPTPVVTNLVLTRADGTTHVHTADSVTHRFAYQGFSENVNGLLAQWDTTGDARWQVKLSVFDSGGILIGTDTHVIQLDNTPPDASIAITSGTGDCGKFAPGAMLSGVFVARDAYLGGYGLSVEPAVNDPGEGMPTPGSGLVNTAPAPGASWSLDTTGMRPCGYVIRVSVSDRSIVDSQSVGRGSSAAAGFCLDGSMEDEE